jgi:hypothetical protein
MPGGGGLIKSDTPAAKRARRLISKIKRRCRKGYLGYDDRRQDEFLIRTTCGPIRVTGNSYERV